MGSKFKKFVFLLYFFRARTNEIFDRRDNALRLISSSIAPNEFSALREVYLIRLISLDMGAVSALSRLSSLRATPPRWLRDPQTAEELYAKRYCDYLQAALCGNDSIRTLIAEDLKNMDVKGLWKSSLLVT